MTLGPFEISQMALMDHDLLMASFHAWMEDRRRRENDAIRRTLGMWVSEVEPVLMCRFDWDSGQHHFIGLGAAGTGVIIAADETMLPGAWHEMLVTEINLPPAVRSVSLQAVV